MCKGCHGLTYLVQFDTQIVERLSSHASSLADQPQQKMLRADVRVFECLRFLLSKLQDVTCPSRKTIKAVV